MKFSGTLLILALLMTACSVSSANHTQATDPGGFDKALADFQTHLVECPYPAAHVMVFARSWNIPEFVVQAYVPKSVEYDKGKTD